MIKIFRVKLPGNDKAKKMILIILVIIVCLLIVKMCFDNKKENININNSTKIESSK